MEDWPWQYQFPPFFSIQPNLETRKKQIEAWCNLVLSYHRRKKSYSIDIGEIQTSPLFFNKKIDRKLSLDGIYTVLDELQKRGENKLRRLPGHVTRLLRYKVFMYTGRRKHDKSWHVEWKDPKTRRQCLLMWRTPEEWGKIIYNWVSSKSMNNSVCTLYELSNGEDSEGEEFHGLEQWLLVRALQTLQSQGKAELMDEEGVKFF